MDGPRRALRMWPALKVKNLAVSAAQNGRFNTAFGPPRPPKTCKAPGVVCGASGLPASKTTTRAKRPLAGLQEAVEGYYPV